MLIISSQIDLNGERWFFPYKSQQEVKRNSRRKTRRYLNSVCWWPVARIHNTAHAMRWCGAISTKWTRATVGTDAFDLASVGEIDSVDDLLIDNCARFLLKDWEGVGELVDGTETAVAYTPERGVALLKQNPSLYWLILAEAANIAQGKEQQTQETVKKP